MYSSPVPFVTVLFNTHTLMCTLQFSSDGPKKLNYDFFNMQEKRRVPSREMRIARHTNLLFFIQLRRATFLSEAQPLGNIYQPCLPPFFVYI